MVCVCNGCHLTNQHFLYTKKWIFLLSLQSLNCLFVLRMHLTKLSLIILCEGIPKSQLGPKCRQQFSEL